MTVLVHTAHPDPDDAVIQFVDRDTAIAAADYLSLHTRADPTTTRRIINSDTLRAMKSTAILINTARGSLVDEPALAAALRTGQIAGAALDVVDVEPLPADSPLRGLDNVVITSHLAGQTAEARTRAGLAAAHERAGRTRRPRTPPPRRPHLITAPPKGIPTMTTHSGKTHRIAVIPGDGIGTEVVPEGLRVLDAAAAAFDCETRLRPLRSLQRRLLLQARQDAARQLVRRTYAASTPCSSVRSAGPTWYPTTSRCGAVCCSSAEPSTSTSTSGRSG